MSTMKLSDVKTYLMERAEAWAPFCQDIALQIWKKPELAYGEFFASKLQAEAMQKNGFRIKQTPGMETAFTAEIGSGHLAFAAELAKTMNSKFSQKVRSLYKVEDKDMSGDMHIGTIKTDVPIHRPSSDFCNITRIVPGAMFFAATVPLGFPLHCWQATSCTGTDLGMKAMDYAAKVLSATVCDLMEQPDCLNTIKQEFNSRREKKS